MVGQYTPRLRVVIVPPSPDNGRVAISRELRGVVVFASSSVAVAGSDGPPAGGNRPLSPRRRRIAPVEIRISGKMESNKLTECLTTAQHADGKAGEGRADSGGPK